MSANRMTLLLRLAASACFLCHGILAIKNSSVYYSEWNVWLQRLLPMTGTQGAFYFLRTVGAIDIIVALNLLRANTPLICFIWAIGWGAATALSRLFFLGAFSGPLWYNLVRPISECLIRMPNWIVPLLLLQHQTGQIKSWKIPRLDEVYLLGAAFVSVATALLLHYFVELNGTLFPWEIVRKGEPLWFFHSEGFLLCVAFIAAGAARTCRASGLLKISVLCAFSAIAASEAFEAFFINAPHGFVFTSIRVGEHFPTYLCTILAAFASIAPRTLVGPLLDKLGIITSPAPQKTDH